MKKLIAFIIACASCTSEVTTKHPTNQPLEWLGQLSDPDAGYGFAWAANDAGVLPDQYLHEPIDLDSGANGGPVDAATVTIPVYDTGTTLSNAYGKQACYWYRIYEFENVNRGQSFTQSQHDCDFDWVCYNYVLDAQCVNAAQDHIGDQTWDHYVKGSCQPCYLGGTL